MVTYHCDTCYDTGVVPWMVEMDPTFSMEPDADGMVPCPDCQHDPATCPDGHEECWPTLVDRVRRAARGWWVTARALWADRNADAIAATIEVRRDVLYDEPRLLDAFQRDLRQRLDDVPTPLGWRRDDLRRALRNAGRAVRGRPTLTPEHEEVTAVELVDAHEHADLFIRTPDIALIVATRRRRLVRRA